MKCFPCPSRGALPPLHAQQRHGAGGPLASFLQWGIDTLQKRRIALKDRHCAGRNALGDTVASQKKAVEVAAKPLRISRKPARRWRSFMGTARSRQNQRRDSCAVAGGMATEDMPFAECVAMSQGYIGFHLQMAIESAFRSRGMDRKSVLSLRRSWWIWRIPRSLHPTKPVGAFYTLEEAAR